MTSKKAIYYSKIACIACGGFAYTIKNHFCVSCSNKKRGESIREALLKAPPPIPDGNPEEYVSKKVERQRAKEQQFMKNVDYS